jgi:cysteinyl-tRNA synthetase
VREQETAFSAALARQDLTAAVGAILELESQITGWANDIPAGDALDRARASLRSLVVELGKWGDTGARDVRELIEPFVEALLELRARARSYKRFDESDWIRERLGELGVALRDGPEETEWRLDKQAGAGR